MPIPSSPASFDLNSGNGWSQVVTFAIPAGVYISGRWEEKGNVQIPYQVPPGIIAITTSGHQVSLGTPPTGNFDLVVSLSPAQLSDANAAAGGTLDRKSTRLNSSH